MPGIERILGSLHGPLLTRRSVLTPKVMLGETNDLLIGTIAVYPGITVDLDSRGQRSPKIGQLNKLETV